MSWVNHGRGATGACVHGTVPSRAPTVQASKRSVNAAIATDTRLQQDVMSMHRVPTWRSPDPAKPDGFRSRDDSSPPAMDEAFELRLHHSSDSARSVLESGWEAAPSKVVFSTNKRTRRTRRASCPARTHSSKPRRAAGLVAADKFLIALETEISTIGVDHGGCDAAIAHVGIVLMESVSMCLSSCPSSSHCFRLYCCLLITRDGALLFRSLGTSNTYTCRRSKGTLRLLTREEEKKLFVLVTRCTAHSLRCRGDVAPEDVTKLAQAMSVSFASAESILEQARRAHEILFRFNIRLVASLAQKHARSGFSVPFLMSEASNGLSDAIDRFDLSRECKFSSFAFHYILRDIRKCIVTESRSILIPADAHYTLSNLLKAKEDMLSRLPLSQREHVREQFRSNPEAMHKALAEEVGMSETAVARLMKAGLPTFDLDAPVYDSADDSWLEFNAGKGLGGEEDDDNVGGEGEYEAEVREQVALSSLDSLLATLDARERNILRLRYGINAEGRIVTLAEIASAYNLSSERVRQISDGALRKLAKPWRQEFLQEQSQDLL